MQCYCLPQLHIRKKDHFRVSVPILVSSSQSCGLSALQVDWRFLYQVLQRHWTTLCLETLALITASSSWNLSWIVSRMECKYAPKETPRWQSLNKCLGQCLNWPFRSTVLILQDVEVCFQPHLETKLDWECHCHHPLPQVTLTIKKQLVSCY